jgi:hypothetical protein
MCTKCHGAMCHMYIEVRIKYTACERLLLISLSSFVIIIRRLWFCHFNGIYIVLCLTFVEIFHIIFIPFGHIIPYLDYRTAWNN